MSDDGQMTLDEAVPLIDVSPYWASRASAFHEENPDVYLLLVRYAREAVRAGVGRVGIELLWNRMRWDKTVITNDSEFKLNQNYKAWYARRIMERESDLRGLFETRSRN
jgi:hypothetical protein